MLYTTDCMQVPRIWGSLVNKAGERVGELWWVYDGPSGSSTLSPVSGGTSSSLSRVVPGSDKGETGPFPLMVKTLHTADRLSVQVHPGAGGVSPSKEESWVVLEADPGAWMTGGFTGDVDPAVLADAARSGSLPDLLEKQSLSTGDVVHLPPGTIHSLGPGLTVLEVQDNCDITYRLFDWGRKGSDGKPRRLDLQRGLDSISLESVPCFLEREECTGGIPGSVSYYMKWITGPMEVDVPPLSVFFLDRGCVTFGSTVHSSLCCLIADAEGGELRLENGSSGWMTGAR